MGYVDLSSSFNYKTQVTSARLNQLAENDYAIANNILLIGDYKEKTFQLQNGVYDSGLQRPWLDYRTPYADLVSFWGWAHGGTYGGQGTLRNLATPDYELNPYISVYPMAPTLLPKYLQVADGSGIRYVGAFQGSPYHGVFNVNAFRFTSGATNLPGYSDMRLRFKYKKILQSSNLLSLNSNDQAIGNSLMAFYDYNNVFTSPMPSVTLPYEPIAFFLQGLQFVDNRMIVGNWYIQVVKSETDPKTITFAFRDATGNYMDMGPGLHLFFTVLVRVGVGNLYNLAPYTVYGKPALYGKFKSLALNDQILYNFYSGGGGGLSPVLKAGFKYVDIIDNMIGMAWDSPKEYDLSGSFSEVYICALMATLGRADSWCCYTGIIPFHYPSGLIRVYGQQLWNLSGNPSPSFHIRVWGR